MKNIQAFLIIAGICISLWATSQKTTFNYKTDYTAYLKRSQDTAGAYFYRKLKGRLISADTTLSPKALLHLLIYSTSLPDYNPIVLDTLCKQLYDENEKGNYKAAIEIADSILKITPIDLTAIKEKSLALKKLGRIDEFSKYSVLTRKTIEAFLLSGDGYFEHPFFGTHYFDGVTFYGAAYQCYPSKSGLMLDKKGRLLAAFYCYSQKADNIIIQYFQIDHAQKFYKPDVSEGKEQ